MREFARFDVFSAPILEPRPIQTPLRLSPPFDVVDATTFQSGDTRIVLTDISGLSRNAVCLDEAGLRFACGLMGRASLANFLRSNTITCVPRFEIGVSKATRSTCYLAGTDLSEFQIRAGFAMPTDRTSARYREAVAIAESERSGAWNGRWAIAPQ